MELKLSTYGESIKAFLLLIVPYGIETSELTQLLNTSDSFNCTLWN